ncbi:MAG TPA: serine/threonine-protein kinase [Planctomycetota bacterium]
MQIRCTTCTKTIAIAEAGALPPACPHCHGAPVPEQLGPFALQRLVAAGGMGEVYLARHKELGTEVALKLLPAMPLQAAASVRERFAREARLTARVQHPGVVRVLDADVAGDRPWLVLEYVDGQTLRHRLAQGPLPVVEAARIAASTADVLAAAHEHGVLHRDIKPDNVMLSRDGTVRVLDFGIARAMSDEAPLTRTGEILGTPEYMAPEQLLDGPEATDERTDVHALGVLLYELLTQRSPFHGANLFQALKLVESLVPPKPSSVRADAAVLDDAVMRALQKHREDRFAGPAAFAAAVRTAVPAAAMPGPARPRRAVWLLWLPLAAVLVLGVVLIVVVKITLREQLDGVAGLALEAARTVVDDATQAAARTMQVHEMLADGRWSHALVLAEQGLAAGDRWLLPAAQDAFLLTHCVWPIAAGMPAWLGACDERQRERLFGGGGEKTAAGDRLGNARCLLAHGDARGALAVLQERPADAPAADVMEQRLLLLAAHNAEADAASLRSLPKQLGLEADAVARLLSLRFLPRNERAQALAEHAARVPLEEPEHWLALRCAAGSGADAAAAEQRAEMAWLHGAGELAVLLDAGLQTLCTNGEEARKLDARQILRLQKRLATDPADTPASVALQALLLLAAGDAPAADNALTALPLSAPATLLPFQQWLAAVRSADPGALALQRGLAAWRIGRSEVVRQHCTTSNSAAATICRWLLDRQAQPDDAPRELPGDAMQIAAELVRGDATQAERLLAAAAVRPEHQLQFLRLAVLAGAEPDFTAAPWRTFAEPPARAQFEQEVNGGLRR